MVAITSLGKGTQMSGRRSFVSTAMALACAGILAAPTVASAVTVYVEFNGTNRGSAYTSSWSSLTAKDLSCDGTGIYSEYYRGSNYGQVYVGGGCGSSAGSGSSSSLISRMRVCMDIPASPDRCSSYVYR